MTKIAYLKFIDSDIFSTSKMVKTTYIHMKNKIVIISVRMSVSVRNLRTIPCISTFFHCYNEKA
ncbi:hypothetical protein NSQ59_17645 [Margalitia sp. FSL K6-0131]|uniref:hypothetical protein n=1 Tax=Margalitia sp. FSL K6-0131 TaxID=2954604 RepID=UPI0030F9CC80